MTEQKERRLLTSLILLTLQLVIASSAIAADKYALLVGISQYSHSRMNEPKPLQYPEADATAVGKLLQQNGYTVTTLLGKDASQESIQKELDKLASQGSDGGVCLVGLFGHGVQYGENAYFAPWDTGIRTPTDSQGEKLRNKDGSLKLEPDPESMTSMRDILDALATAGVSNRILLADCCREDPNAARGRAFGSKLSVADLPRGMAALFACSEGERAYEHKDWGHGAFTHALLKHLRNPVADLTANRLGDDLFIDVKKAVEEKTGGELQTVHAIANGRAELHLTTASDAPKDEPKSMKAENNTKPDAERVPKIESYSIVLRTLTCNAREEDFQKFDDAVLVVTADGQEVIRQEEKMSDNQTIQLNRQIRFTRSVGIQLWEWDGTERRSEKFSTITITPGQLSGTKEMTYKDITGVAKYTLSWSGS